VPRAQRLALDDGVGGRVLGTEQRAAAVGGLLQLGAQGGDAGDAAAGDVVEQVGQQRVAQPLAGAEQPAAGREDGAAVLGEQQDVLQQDQQPGLQLVQDGTRAREPHGRCDDLRERQASERPAGVHPPVEAAGHRHRAPAGAEGLVGGGEAQRDRHWRRRHRVRRAPAARGVDEEVEQPLGTVRRGPQQEPSAAGARQRRLGGARGEAGGDRGVDGVARRPAAPRRRRRPSRHCPRPRRRRASSGRD
jgi:hypothetical protein